MQHPTQIFLSNPQALRIEYRLDDQCLELWWSPLAGVSYDCADRNYSSRDAHLNVFESITLPGCDKENFLSCDYDAYHAVLRFREQTLHLCPCLNAPAVYLWTEKEQTVDFKTGRFDSALKQTEDVFAVQRQDPRYRFDFVAQLGSGSGAFRHCHFRGPESSLFSSASLEPSQPLLIGVQLSNKNFLNTTATLARIPPKDHLEQTEHELSQHEKAGNTVSDSYPEIDAFRRKCVRILHSMIDESGTFRASLKPIYYLIWMRDSGMSFYYQSASGWPHRLTELGCLMLENPNAVEDPAIHPNRRFGQLIDRTYGKLEEDGIYFVVWVLFTNWIQGKSPLKLGDSEWSLIDEALEWTEAMTWDEERGLFGEHFADETPTFEHRDYRWDYAIGKPISGSDVLMKDGQLVSRNYDIYFNTVMHSTYVMLAAMRGAPSYLEKANRLWPELEKLLEQRNHGIPIYAEQVLTEGRRVIEPHWGQVTSCCVWGLTMPNFLPLADRDEVLESVLDEVMKFPKMHWINGICGAMAAVDPWTYPESKLIEYHEQIVAEANRSGEFLPMPGAMPEKFGAPQGNLYHDIRPQGFAIGTWLAAWSSLGVRRLPYGIALRPTSAFRRLENFQWKGKSISFELCQDRESLALEINGELVHGTLQLPEVLLRKNKSSQVSARIVKHPEGRKNLWLRSTVQLDEVDSKGVLYSFTAYGLSSVTFSQRQEKIQLRTESGDSLPYTTSECKGLQTINFTHFGKGRLALGTD